MDEHSSEEDYAALEGMISIRAALEAGSRPVRALFIRQGKDDADTRRLERAARDAGARVLRVPDAEIDARAQGKTHGGLLAEVGSRRFVSSLEALLPAAGEPAFVAMLDGVEDPFNFGAAVRCLYAAGANGLVVRPRNWLSAVGVVARASAGASERLPTAIAESAGEAADFFRGRGVTIACAVGDAPGATSLYDADLRGPLFLLIGGEKRGITRSFRDGATLQLCIPYGRPRLPLSLGTASAAAVLAFEVMRQRHSR